MHRRSYQSEWNKTYGNLSATFRPSLFKLDIWKLRKHGHKHCESDKVCDIRNRPGMCGRSVHYITSPSLFFNGKEWTNMAAPWQAQIWSKAVLLLYRYWKRHHMKPADGNIYTLWCFQTPVHLCWGSLSIWAVPQNLANATLFFYHQQCLKDKHICGILCLIPRTKYCAYHSKTRRDIWI